MTERIKELRKSLKLSQAAFAEKIGISQGTFAFIESGKSNLTPRNADAICRVFNVNSKWLKEGKGKIFNETSFLDQLAAEKGLNEREKALIQSIIDLPPEVREGVIDWALAFAKKVNEIPAESEKEKRLREIAEQRQRLDEEERKLTGGMPLVEESLNAVG